MKMNEKTLKNRISELQVFFLLALSYIGCHLIEYKDIFAINLSVKAAIKVSPICYLIYYVIKQRRLYITKTGSHPYTCILPALILCGAGDVLLVMQVLNPLYFIAGLFSFLLGHVGYIFSFGLRPLHGNLLIFFIGVVVSCSKILFMNYKEEYWLEVALAAYLYSPVIFTMLWRSTVRVNWSEVKKGKYTKLLGAVGATLFAISDLTLAINKFQFAIPGAHFIVMTLYYLAQLFIVLSIQ